MTTIDPTTCKPGEAYMVRVDGRESIAVRLDDDSRPWWITAGWRSDDLNTWHPDSAVTVLHRLVPEPEEKVLDVPMQPWDILREAESIARHLDGIERSSILAHANHLEREHRAAQEKAEQDAAREALIVKAASVSVTHPNGAVVSVGLPYARALADAGYLAEAVQP
ncbi:hypothetical protein nbrc107696_45880 [Gordonia spumicola]|uniref:Uncharacterized protein n=1 Tax=Gordonia spumicola TaxID=589161 RepID=A0A7I9V4U4_9ACTN|nr:hypothetical protein [Gordonia spumicola]GEE00213.1 hypothetical protein nbrc107696_06590 [Gordonia spumicola]GEE04142.1 hypothetical protein nbrc107696_45880 [Gordonia spumicola]